ncbi:MAG: hypothetical protein PHN76_08855 [Advenella sp.]|uniref:hypothetical protein n=1 Tax=Advenella sp. TaxID=1872388 RepID=UPI00258AD76C|nr:hypothetical protein [Advenella sp.]MDD3758261.1 hypothetical protein [Advenella sp.]
MINEFSDLPTSLAWQFTHTLSGTFKRNRREQLNVDFPILAPLPTQKNHTLPLEGYDVRGPFIYFVTDSMGALYYIGKSKEINVLNRWIRPGNGGPATHYWTHSVKDGGCVFNIAEGLNSKKGPYDLRFISLAALKELLPLVCKISSNIDIQLKQAESYLILRLKPIWNKR